MSFQLWQWILVGVGVTGAVIMARSIRMGTLFQNATAIPDQFFVSQVSLHGRVQSVEPDGILRVSHVPILQFPFTRGVLESVRVKLAAVGHTEKSISYLQSDLIGKPVSFKLLGREDPDIADCIVRFQKGGIAHANLNMYLVRTGRATVQSNPQLEGIDSYDKLAKKLRLIEQYANRKSVLRWTWDLAWKIKSG
ncbi:hypothetical protein BV898_17812 [Hypsibius exemplaris]|uniref:Uncharacterized protein n=1 Tax=Hypsibius exemplaris TaxID=2072580 RepID=A0A9X6NG13_HYPEX|nr:hypothetical protein BV898_17812 [Hypsibius exemplaris]